MDQNTELLERQTRLRDDPEFSGLIWMICLGLMMIILAFAAY